MKSQKKTKITKNYLKFQNLAHNSTDIEQKKDRRLLSTSIHASSFISVHLERLWSTNNAQSERAMFN